jgi:hypothetical protein
MLRHNHSNVRLVALVIDAVVVEEPSDMLDEIGHGSSPGVVRQGHSVSDQASHGCRSGRVPSSSAPSTVMWI